jgi:hypothetical protein
MDSSLPALVPVKVSLPVAVPALDDTPVRVAEVVSCEEEPAFAEELFPCVPDALLEAVTWVEARLESATSAGSCPEASCT